MEEKQINNPEEIEVNIGELLLVLWSKAAIIILSGTLLGLLALVGTKLLITPQYVSETKIYVLSQQSDSGLTQGDMQASTFLTKDYAELIKSRTVTEAVKAEIGLTMVDEELSDKISVSTPADTRVIQISVKDPDPYEAAKIANSVRGVASSHIQDVMGIDAVNTVETANIPEEPSSPSTMRNAAVGGTLGVLLACVLVLIIHIKNDAIQTGEDIEKYLGISVLGNIPLREGEKKKKNKYSRLRKK